ncbi:ABC-type Fe3+-hydroxamate transport system, periplasmic component [Hoyosella subflava DQS3-9A1]|uniref:ABC-type Fe3+-hydroxamate transport system, periplasmic component n=1 Tax=Hoyosella subflava (strain DSM 45089 / JCM 17490 / NBRC 109087 / DQS3-9A1) TaxID=443218 RepID=F6EIS5_HOYSD|nr:ABC-type Fe3+-hydroxamate transport system, periplasmic component [Hoyosella subflava DQS3-9A1]
MHSHGMGYFVTHKAWRRNAARAGFKSKIVLSVILAAGVLTAACGSTDDADASGQNSLPAAPTEEGAFPVTIEHQFGETTITDAPQRVAAVGLADTDALLALDVIPVLVTPWGGATEASVGEWAIDALGGTEPVVHEYSDGINVELIASTDPDLIVAINQSIDQSTYEQLSAIAPTIVRPAEFIDWGVPWQDATRMIGAAVGQPARAEEVVAETEDLFTQVRSGHPEIAGKTGVVMLLNEAGGYYTYTEEDGRGQFMKALGFTLPPQLRELEQEGQFYVDVSAENAPLLESDILVVLANHNAAEVLRDDAAFQSTGVGRENRYVVVDSSTGVAMSMATVLSIPYALDQLVPEIIERVN